LDTTNNALADKGAPVRRRAFTIVELLLVISIITILATLLFVAYSKVTASRHISDTKTMLQTASTLLNNYEQATHFNRPLPDLSTATNSNIAVAWGPANNAVITAAQWTAPSSAAAANPQQDLLHFWTKGLVDAAGNSIAEEAPQSISIDALNGGVTSGNYANSNKPLPQQVVDTICVMYALESIPDNQAIISNLPSQDKIQVSIMLNSTANPPVVTTVSLLADGWGNPILFVPGNGLYGVMTSAVPTYNSSQIYNQGDLVVYSNPNGTFSGSYLYTWMNAASGPAGSLPQYPPPSPPTAFQQPPYTNTFDAKWGGVCAPGLRPYWVSAGPDGDVSNARGDPTNSQTSVKKDDDNIYSFNN
jgi:prepilin-type N-terminal cleavage/methylation domain-containing protein